MAKEEAKRQKAVTGVARLILKGGGLAGLREYVKCRIVTVNEARAEVGLEPVAWGDGDPGLVPKVLQVSEIVSAVRAGTRVSVLEMRQVLGLSEEAGSGAALRFNDEDVLQYHVENDILTINEIRQLLGREEVPWGKETPGQRKARPAQGPAGGGGVGCGNRHRADRRGERRGGGGGGGRRGTGRGGVTTEE